MSSATSTTTTVTLPATNDKPLPTKKISLSSSSLTSSFISLVSGGIGGASAVVVGYPWDLAKVRLQTLSHASASVASTTPSTTSLSVLFRQIVQTEGWRGLYRGMSAPLVSATPLVAVYFWSFDASKQFVQWTKQQVQQKMKRSATTIHTTRTINNNNHHHHHHHQLQPPELTLMEFSIAGGLSALPAVIVTAPSERIKCVLQASTNPNAANMGAWQCARQLYRQGGIGSLYKGTVLTLLRYIPSSTVFFGTYAFLKQQFVIKTNSTRTNTTTTTSSTTTSSSTNHSSHNHSLSIVVAGGIAGILSQTVSHPMDVVKSRFQAAAPGMYRSGWAGMRDVFQELWHHEGLSGFTRGMRPALIRAFPANAACFYAMEVSKEWMELQL